jgi:acyl-CoA synthetase (AMP-forming)/AMP-acid ligase II
MSVSTTPTPGSTLLPPLANPNDQEAIRFGPRALTYRELTGVATYLAGLLESKPRVAIWAVPAPETCAAVVGALVAGVPVVPINPKAGERELAHIVADSSPPLLLTAPGAELPPQLAGVPRIDKATLLWDGLPAHRSHAMGAWLGRQRSWLVVEPLPGYAPELNPVEPLCPAARAPSWPTLSATPR